MFEKAQRKVAEYAFFLHYLDVRKDPDATEYFFNALLNAGRNVEFVLRAHVKAYEETRLPAKKAEKKASKDCNDRITAWKTTLPGPHAGLYAAFQSLRNSETHDVSSAHRPRQQAEEPRSASAMLSDP